jgi:hypothetical protein
LRIKPTIVIGHGAFGLAVLRRFLRKTAPRGSLIPAGLAAADDDGRRLRDIALLWMPEPSVSVSASSAAELQSADDPYGRADFLRDLYRQIDTVPNMPGAAETVLCDKVADAARFLRSPELVEARAGLDGLDVIVVAQARKAADITALDSLNRALLSRLMQNYREWCEGQRAARKLHCIAIYDFDNYRGGSDDDRRLRRAVQASMEGWQRALEHPGRVPRPILDRCYLLDGRAGEAHRGPRNRRDEITLFLELLLFGGVRDDEMLKFLFQQGSNVESVAAGFGVRALERSPQLLSRLAAARFGAGWLAWLRGDADVRSGRRAAALEAALKPLLAEIDQPELTRAAIERTWVTGAAGLADAVLGLPGLETERWGEQAERHLTERSRDLERDLLQVGLAQISALRSGHLGEAGAAVRAAIDQDLHNPHAPVPLAAVLGELDDALARLRAQASTETPVAPPPALSVGAAHRTYLDASGHWLAEDGAALSRFWPLLAAVSGLAATPFAQDLLRQLPLLAATDSPWQKQLSLWVERLDQPLVIAPALFICTWLALRAFAQPRVERAVARARAFHLDPRRGRLAAAVRADCDALSGIRERVLRNVQATVGNDLLALLSALRERLKQREREMLWLGEQLEEFARMFGLERGKDVVQPPADDAHRWLVSPSDLTTMMQRRPDVSGQFEASQPDLPKPFEGWSERHCERFLDLFGFLDNLSRLYLDAFVNQAGEGRADAEWALRGNALRQLLQRRLDVGFSAAADQDQAQTRSFAVLPEEWRGHAAAADALRALGINNDDLRPGSDPARLYLLAVRFGVAPAALEAPG